VIAWNPGLVEIAQLGGIAQCPDLVVMEPVTLAVLGKLLEEQMPLELQHPGEEPCGKLDRRLAHLAVERLGLVDQEHAQCGFACFRRIAVEEPEKAPPTMTTSYSRGVASMAQHRITSRRICNRAAGHLRGPRQPPAVLGFRLIAGSLECWYAVSTGRFRTGRAATGQARRPLVHARLEQQALLGADLPDHPWVPWFLLLPLHHVTSLVCFASMRRERAAVRRNLERVTGKTGWANFRLAYRLFFNFSRFMVTYIELKRLDPKVLATRVGDRERTDRAVQSLIDEGRGAIMVTMHLGHWDWRSSCCRGSMSPCTL